MLLAYLISEVNKFRILALNNGVMPDIMFGLARYIVSDPMHTEDARIVSETELLEQYSITSAIDDKRGSYCVEKVLPR